MEYKKFYEQLGEMLEATEHHIYVKLRSLHRYRAIKMKLKSIRRQVRKGWIKSVKVKK